MTLLMVMAKLGGQENPELPHAHVVDSSFDKRVQYT